MSDWEIKDFADCILQSGLHEFNYVGAFFTWTNKTIWSRIDRALYNDLWHDTFVFTHVNFMTQGLSNDTPITLSFPHCLEPKHSLIFCDMWTKDRKFKDLVKHSIKQDMPDS